MRFLSFVFLFFLYTAATLAQQPPFRHYTVDDGLSSNTVYDIEQDERGFIWFSTSAGVSRFDGHSFVRLALEDGLSDNDVIKIRKDNTGRLWLMGFNSTITVIEEDTIYSGNTHPLLKKLNTGFFISEFYEEAPGILLLSNRRDLNARVQFPDSISYLPPMSQYIFKTSKGYIELIKPSVLQIEDEPGRTVVVDQTNPVNEWCYYRDSLLYMVTKEGVVTIDKNHRVRILNIPADHLRNCLEIYCDNNRNIWVTSYNTGLRMYSRNGETYTFGGSWFSKENITSVFEDSEKNIWFSTHGNGVFMMPANFASVSAYTREEGLHDNEAYSILHDRKGRTWLGYKNAWIDVMSDSGITSIKLSGDTISMSRTLRMSEMQDGSILAGTDIGTFLIKEVNGKFSPKRFTFTYFNERLKKTSLTAIKGIELQDDGSALIVSLEGVHKFTPEQLNDPNIDVQPLLLPVLRYYTICADTGGGFWYADNEGLKYYYNGKIKSYADKDPILRNRITSMARYGTLLLMSIEGYGVAVLKNGRHVSRITTADGLLSNHTGRIFIGEGNAYICTNKGISVLDLDYKDKPLLRSITTADGLLSNQVNDVFADSNNLYAASQRGLSVIRLSILNSKTVSAVPRIFLTEATWQGRDILKQDQPELSYRSGNIRFKFISPFFSFPEGVRYEYRLNDEPWIGISSNTVEFNSLLPGIYVFEVRSSFPNSGWSKSATYSFIIPQPFYTAWWFYMSILLLIVTAVMLLYRYNSGRLKKEQQIKLEYEQQINRLQGQSLQAMMNPHFIFNSLNAIQQQIRAGHTESAGTYLSRFSKLLRMNLETISEDLIPLSEELERVKLYLDTEKLRLGDKMQYEIHVDPEIDTDNTLIPSMIIQPFLENAIWHGIMPAERQGTVSLNIKLNSAALHIVIDDNGSGIQEEPAKKNTTERHSHFGIRLTRQRLLFLQKKLNQPVTLEVADKRASGGQGTVVSIVLPLLPKA